MKPIFKLTPNPTFLAIALITVPGETDPAPLTLEFKHLTTQEIKAYFENLFGKTDAEALSEIVVGWRDVDTPFSPEALAKLLDHYPPAAGEVFAAYRQAALESRQKNS